MEQSDMNKFNSRGEMFFRTPNAEYALKESLVRVARPEYLRAELTI